MPDGDRRFFPTKFFLSISFGTFAAACTSTSAPPPSASVPGPDGGCSVPVVTARKSVKQSLQERADASGTVRKVSVSTFESMTDLVYEPGSHQPAMKFERMTEFRIDSRIFEIEVFAREFPTGSESNSDHPHAFVFRCVDRDGSGRFQPVKSGDTIPVPAWAVATDR